MKYISLKERLKSEVSEHKGELVVCGFDIMLLLDGIADDGEDYYYRFCSIKGYEESSCVIGWTPLKNNITEGIYKDLMNIFKLNYKYHTTKEQKKEIQSLIGK